MKDLISESIESVNDDLQNSMNVASLEFPPYVLLLSLEPFIPICTFGVTLNPFPEWSIYIIVLQNNPDRIGIRIPNNFFNTVLVISVYELSQEVVKLPMLRLMLRSRHFVAVRRVERNSQKDESLTVGCGLFTSREPAPGTPHPVFIVLA